jgi:hypothetical protein
MALSTSDLNHQKCWFEVTKVIFFIKKPWWSKFGTMNLTSTTTYIFNTLDEFPAFTPNFDHFQGFKKSRKALAMPGIVFWNKKRSK